MTPDRTASGAQYRLLARFAETFAGGRYLHRNANLGNRIADLLYEDLYGLAGDSLFHTRVDANSRVLNPRNTSPGIRARRGDGSFGQTIPGTLPQIVPGRAVLVGPTADVEIGAEVKIIAKAMIKQIDRVVSDLRGQADHLRKKSPGAITVAIVGVNHAESYTSYEGGRSYPTDGRRYPHPRQEAAEATRRIRDLVTPAFDELVVLPFRATNVPPYPFEWVAPDDTVADYGAMLVRVLKEYGRRFASDRA